MSASKHPPLNAPAGSSGFTAAVSDQPVHPPREGEMINGCECSPACGRIREVKSRLDSGDWRVLEDFHGRQRSVRREPDGNLWEVRFGFRDE